MPSFQEYHATLSAFCAQVETIPAAEDTPVATLVRTHALIEGYQMALADLNSMWAMSAAWRIETPRPEFAAHLQTLQDLVAQRLGLVPATVGAPLGEASAVGSAACPAAPATSTSAPSVGIATGTDLPPAPDAAPRPQESG